jgi:hypothetical protein
MGGTGEGVRAATSAATAVLITATITSAMTSSTIVNPRPACFLICSPYGCAK